MIFRVQSPKWGGKAANETLTALGRSESGEKGIKPVLKDGEDHMLNPITPEKWVLSPHS